MVIQIRIVIRIPFRTDDFHTQIEHILERVYDVFPGLSSVKYQSPITITIDEFKEPFGNLGENEDIKTDSNAKD